MRYFSCPISLAPLATFRVVFGLVMAFSLVRFWAKGWIATQFVEPTYFFSYWGFEWVQPPDGMGMYVVFGGLIFSALMVAIGAGYRFFAWLFFFGFTYTELIDKTYYLNHYYFVSLAALLLAILPAHAYGSVDAWRRGWRGESVSAPRWIVGSVRLQLGLVYFFAGVAKIHPEWLFAAQPLSIWLPPKSDLPFFGKWFRYEATAYVFSWFGMLYDLSIPFLLLVRRFRPLAYLAVVVFHVLTWVLFDIGMFPWIMIGATLIFFPAGTHERVWGWVFRKKKRNSKAAATPQVLPAFLNVALVLFFVIQFTLPLRYLCYPGELFWHEQGYRFSWRVMLMEKNGEAEFRVEDRASGRSRELLVSDYLTPYQEKMMATQPDMILQFAHHLANEARRTDFSTDPAVYADVWVSLNGRRSRRFVDPAVDLAAEEESWRPKKWILSAP